MSGRGPFDGEARERLLVRLAGAYAMVMGPGPAMLQWVFLTLGPGAGIDPTAARWLVFSFDALAWLTMVASLSALPLGVVLVVGRPPRLVRALLTWTGTLATVALIGWSVLAVCRLVGLAPGLGVAALLVMAGPLLVLLLIVTTARQSLARLGEAA
jgi:hypothetical protein